MRRLGHYSYYSADEGGSDWMRTDENAPGGNPAEEYAPSTQVAPPAPAAPSSSDVSWWPTASGGAAAGGAAPATPTTEAATQKATDPNVQDSFSTFPWWLVGLAGVGAVWFFTARSKKRKKAAAASAVRRNRGRRRRCRCNRCHGRR